MFGSIGQVLPVLLKIGGRLFPAPTQLVPESGSGMDAGKVLDSLSAALKGCLPNPDAKLLTTSETWGHREYRQTTKNLFACSWECAGVLTPRWLQSEPLQTCQPLETTWLMYSGEVDQTGNPPSDPWHGM